VTRRWKLHWSRRRWFHTLRLLFWLVQIPPAVLIPSVRTSVPYLVFLSLAALVESAATDVDQARAAEQQPAPAGGERESSSGHPPS
jgi:type II secretory pathway component PulM